MLDLYGKSEIIGELALGLHYLLHASHSGLALFPKGFIMLDVISHIPVCVRWVPISRTWAVVHAKSYQNAVRGCFATRQIAESFVWDAGYCLERHEHDQLQNLSLLPAEHADNL